MGLWVSRNNHSTEAYFLGNRAFPSWAIGLSLVGTSISSITFLAYPADAFKTTWIRFIPNLALPVAALIVSYGFLQHYRNNKTTTAYQFLEQRFGPSVRTYAALTFIVAQIVRISMILYLVGLLLQQLTGLDIILSVVLAGLFVSVYTVFGGFQAVVWTDVLQTIILITGGLLCLSVIVSAMPGGLFQVLDIAQANNKISFNAVVNGSLKPISWGISFSDKTLSMLFFVGLISWLTEYIANQNTVQRFCASKSTHEAKKAIAICVMSSLPIWAFYMFLGTALFSFFQTNPTEATTAMLNGESKVEAILPYFISNYLPKGIAGIVIAAALAAAMSSVDSSLNSIATVSVVDLYKPKIKKHVTDKHLLHCAWLISAFSSICMILGAISLALIETKTLQHAATVLVSVLSGGLLAIYLLGFTTIKTNTKAIWVGIITTWAFSIWTVLSKQQLIPDSLSAPFDLYYTGLIGNIVLFFVAYATCRMSQIHRDYFTTKV